MDQRSVMSLAFTAIGIILSVAVFLSLLTGKQTGRHGTTISYFEDSPFWFSVFAGFELTIAMCFIFAGNPGIAVQLLKILHIPVWQVMLNQTTTFGALFCFNIVICYLFGQSINKPALSGGPDLPGDTMKRWEAQQRTGARYFAQLTDEEINDRLDLLDDKVRRQRGI